MRKLGSTGRAWLKGFHVFFTCAWVGAGVSMFLLHFAARPGDGHALYGVLTSLKLIDDWIVIPAATGSLLTGLLISWLTPWGFFKWWWVSVKWVLTVVLVIFGTFWLGPWLNGMEAISAANPLGAIQDQTFLTNRRLLSLGVAPMSLALLFMVFVSVIKPWKRTRG